MSISVWDSSILTSLLFISFLKIYIVQSRPLISAKTPCGSFITIENCPKQYVSRLVSTRFRCKYTKGKCKYGIEALSSGIDFGNTSTPKLQRSEKVIETSFVLEEGTFGRGTVAYLCKTEGGKDNQKKNRDITNRCLFSVNPEKPKAVISGGKNRYADSDDILTLDGTTSIDNDEATNKDLKYAWKCEVQAGNKPCPDVSSVAGKFNLDPKSIEQGTKFKISLTVTTVDGETDTAEQTINIFPSIPETSIKCLKNCPPRSKVTDTMLPTVLKLDCTKRCNQIKQVDWDIKDVEKKDIDVNTDLNQITITPNSMKAGLTYTVTAKIEGTEGSSDFTLDVGVAPKIEACSVSPAKGESMSTAFKITCSGDNLELIQYQIRSIVGDKEILVATGDDLSKMTFQLQEGAKVKLKLINTNSLSSETELPVEVTAAKRVKANMTIEEELNQKLIKMNDWIDKDINYKEVVKMLQEITLQVSDLAKKNNSFKSLKDDVNSRSLILMEKMPLPTELTEIEKLAQTSTRIIENAESKPDTTERGTAYCKKLADQSKELSKKKTKNVSDSGIKEAASELVYCSGSGLKDDTSTNGPVTTSKVDDLTDYEANITTTQYPVISVKSITEDYEDYDHDSAEAKLKFQETVLHVKEICYTTGNMMVSITVPGEGIVSFIENDINVTTYKNIGKYFAKSNLQSHGVTLKPSVDYKEINDPRSVVMCTTNKNAFWWNSMESQMTALAIIRFNNQDDTTFKSPYILSFDIKPDSDKIKFKKYIQKEYIYQGISVYRIVVFSTYRIYFNNLNSEEYTVSLTEFMKPTIAELKSRSIKINKNNSFIDQNYSKKYYSWHYLSVLKENNNPVPNISVGTFGCYKYFSDIARWELSCNSMAETSEKTIVCKCYSASIMKATYYDNHVRLEFVEVLNFELELKPQYFVFMLIILQFAFFHFVLLCIAMSKNKNILHRNILFVPDVPLYCQFGYLLIVYTGNRLYAGTTSNITIKLIGAKFSTMEHVLNYPDPARYLLQKGNEDWFILGTERHLGEMKKIIIWFDSIGVQPDWFCQSIEVYDLQSNNYWIFTVKRKFSLENSSDTMYEVEPNFGNTKGKTKFQRCIGNCCSKFDTPHFWVPKRHKLSMLLRLVVVYSITISIFSITLILYGLPEFMQRDGLEYFQNYGLNASIFIFGFSSAFITLVTHCPLVILYGHFVVNIKEAYSKVRLPIAYICWGYFTANIIICNSMLIVFGFWVPTITSLFWIISIALGCLIYAIVFENILKVAYTYIIKEITKAEIIKEKLNVLLEFIEFQRTLIYGRFGKLGLRPYLKHLYNPLDSIELIHQQEYTKMKWTAAYMLNDLIMFVTYVILLGILVIINRDSLTVFNNNQMYSLMHGTYQTKYELESENTIPGIESFVRNILMSSVHASTWYPHYTTFEPGLMLDRQNSYLGVGRFRQHRTTTKVCKLHSFLDYMNITCRPEYYNSQETGYFGEYWKKGKINIFSRQNPIWTYVNETTDGTARYFGMVSTYKGGGYIAPCGRTYKNSLLNWIYMEKHFWIDEATRLLSFEILSYNVNSNLFNAITWTLELSASGAIEKKLFVQTARLLFVHDEEFLVTGSVIILFILVLAIFVIRFTLSIIIRRKLIFKHFDIWLLIDSCIISLSIACIILLQQRDELVKEFLSKLEKTKHNEFIHYFDLFFAERIILLLNAFLICVSILRLWKLLRFIVIFRIMEKTFLLSAGSLASIFVWQLIILLAFILFSYTIFSDKSEDFRTLPNTVVTLMLCAVAHNHKLHFSLFSNHFHYVFYICFMFISIAFTSLYVAVIMIYYQKAQLEFSNIVQYTLKDYIMDKTAFLYNLLKVRSKRKRVRGGEDIMFIYKSIYPKADEHRYANCISINKQRLQQMNCICQCVLRNMRMASIRLRKKDIDLINQTLYTLYSQSETEKEIFFLDYSDRKNVKVLDDYKFQMMEKIVMLILDTDEQIKLKNEQRQMEIYNKLIQKHNTQLNELKNYLDKLYYVVARIRL